MKQNESKIDQKNRKDTDTGADERFNMIGSCPTLLLDDAPSSTDELAQAGEIGPHSRIAKAIAELVGSTVMSESKDAAENNQSGGKMIGIEGGWGSGKTTVIDLLRKEFHNDTFTTMSVFDAWAHRGDPLRRTFLESVVADLRSAEWITEDMYKKEKGWKDKIDSLAKRRRQSTTTTVPETTPLGTWFAISALLVPLGAALVGGSVSRGFTIVWNKPIKWDFVIGFILSFSPIFVALIHWSKEKLRGREPSWALLSGKGTVEQKTTETDMPDPTSLEFEQHFDQLMKDVLGNEPYRRLVLVLDNLDRIDCDDALAIWSTLQTFLQFTQRPDRPWIERLWIIVPYDSGGLRALWEGKAREVKDAGVEDEVTTQMQGKKVTNSEADKEGNFLSTSQSVSKVAESFIDKSFQIRFELPSPVHSNWRSYLKQLIIKALPRHENEADELCRLYGMAQPDYNPTPRELKLFVNQIGMIHRQWPCGTFPLSHIAYYVLLKRRNLNIPDAVLDLPDPGIGAQLPKDPQALQESLAGLAFNVKPHLGMELVLKERIFQAITSGEPDKVEKFAKGYAPGFWALLGDIVILDIAQAAPTDFEKAVRCCMNCSTFIERDHRAETSALFDGLGGRAASEETIWPLFNSSTGEALAKLAGHLDDESRTVLIADSIRRTGSSKEGEEPAINEEWLHGISTFIPKVREIGHNSAIETPFPVECSAEQWIDEVTPKLLALHGESDDPPIWSYLSPSSDPAEIVKALAAIASEPERIEEQISGKTHLVDAVRITNESRINPDWKPMLKTCRNRLNQNQNVAGKEADELLRILLYFYRNGKENPLTDLVNQGHLYHCLSQNQSQKDIGCRTRCLVTTMMINPNLSKPDKMPGNAEQGFNYMNQKLLNNNNAENAQSVLDVIFNEAKPSVLFESIAARSQWDPLFVKALQLIADDSARSLEIPTDLIITKWPSIREQINEDAPERFTRLIRRLATEGSLIEDLRSKEFDVGYVDLYREIIDAINVEGFVDWCVEGIRHVSKGAWKKAFRGENKLFDLIMALKQAGAPFQMPHDYRDALLDFAEETMKDNQAAVPDRLKGGDLDAFELLQDDAQKVDFQTRCAGKMINQGGEIASLFFHLFERHMLEPSQFRGDRGNSSVSELFQGLVTNRNVAASGGSGSSSIKIQNS